MAITTKKSVTNSWLALATAGDVTITAAELPSGYPLTWAVTEGATAPTVVGGHTLQPRENVSMTLNGTERLWITGAGAVFVTAANPV